MENKKYEREKVAFVQGFNFSDSLKLSGKYPNLIVFSKPFLRKGVNIKHIFKEGISYTPIQGISNNQYSFKFDDNDISLNLDKYNYGILSLTKSSVEPRYFYTGAYSNYENYKELKTIKEFLNNNDKSNYDIKDDDYLLLIDSLEDNNKIQININKSNVTVNITYKTIEDFNISNDENNEHNENNKHDKPFDNIGLHDLITLSKGERLYIKNITITAPNNIIYDNLVNIRSTGKFNLMGDLTFNDKTNIEKFTSNYNSEEPNNIIPYLFSGSNVVDASKLKLFTTLKSHIYCGLFEGCKELIAAPELPAGRLNNGVIEGQLAEHCYESMFSGCTLLETAPELPAETLVTDCYKNMFNGCSKLNYIKALFITNIIDENDNTYPYTSNWVKNVAEYGTFIKNDNWNITNTNQTIKKGILGDNGIPELWIDTNNYYKNQYFTIESISDIPIEIQWPSNPSNLNHISIYYNRSNDENDWQQLSSSQINYLKLNNKNDKIYFKGINNISYQNLGFKDIIKNTLITCKYNVTSTTNPTILFYNNKSVISTFSSMIVDGVKLDSVTNNEYTFDTTGEHTVLFILSEGVTSISDNAFSGCSELISIKIENNIEKIGNNVFNGCSRLTSIICNTPSIPLITSDTFKNINNNDDGVKLYIPKSWNIKSNDSLITSDDFVDLGLPSGTIWCTKNLGAKNITDYGYYYQWGNIKEIENLGENENYYENLYQSSLGYNLTNNIPSNSTYDASTKIWANYQIPTYSNINELLNSCNWRWKTYNGKNGYEIEKNGNTLFLPIAGNSYHPNDSSYGRYWSSTISSDNTCAQNLYFGYNFKHWPANSKRYCGYSIRPIMKNPNLYLWMKLFNNDYINIIENDNLSKNQGTFKVYGNIMSLFYGGNNGNNDFKEQTLLRSNYCLFGFLKDSNVIDASNLILPATTLTTHCYSHMFENCTSLVNSPTLPAGKLNDNDEIEGSLASSCYRSMFEGCSSLVNAPELPATILFESCYESMFKDCIKLTTAPTLPAKKLVKTCYCSMFEGCTELNLIKMLGLNIGNNNPPNYSNWVDNVASSGIFIKNDNATWSTSNTTLIPNNWHTKTESEYESNLNSNNARQADFSLWDGSIEDESNDNINYNNINTLQNNISNNYHLYIISQNIETHAYILMPIEWENHLDIYVNDQYRGNIFNIDGIRELKRNIILNDGCKYNFYKTDFVCNTIKYKMSSL